MKKNKLDKNLNPLLGMASNNDLDILINYFKWSKKITGTNLYKKNQPNHTKYTNLIAKEIRYMGGHSFRRILKRTGPSYKKIVCHVAKKLKVPYNRKSTIERIENSILETLFDKPINKTTANERKEYINSINMKLKFCVFKAHKAPIYLAIFILVFMAFGFQSYETLVIVANCMLKLSFATNYILTTIASILVGYIGWVCLISWFVSKPAYRIIIPIVVYIAMMRKTLE